MKLAGKAIVIAVLSFAGWTYAFEVTQVFREERSHGFVGFGELGNLRASV